MAPCRHQLKADEIVLLRFEADAGASPYPRQSDSTGFSLSVRCYTEVVHLQEAPKYAALSYAWGDASITKPILLDGHEVQITSNLESALVHIRSRVSDNEALWVDAICINQQDDAEKSQQVAHMGNVYANAARVIVWLGAAEDSPNVDSALDWVTSFGAQAARLDIRVGRSPRLRDLLSRSENALPNDGDSKEVKDLKVQKLLYAEQLETSLNINDNPNYTSLINSLRGLLTRPYWERLWVVQEFALAKQHDLMCGSRALDFRAVMYAVRMLRGFRLWQTSAGEPAPLQLEEALQRYTQPIPSFHLSATKLFFRAVMKRGDLLYLLRLHRTSKAEDPRDRVFALLGIATDASSLGLVPDYTKSCRQIYTEVARALLRNGQLDVLDCGNDRGKNMLNLKSWVPDWSSSAARASMVVRVLPTEAETSVLESSFKASGSLVQPKMSTEDCLMWDCPLVLSVIIICSVAAVGHPWCDNGIGGWFHSLSALARIPKSSTLSEEVLSNVIWQTAAAGQELLSLQSMKKNNLGPKVLGRLNSAFLGTCWKDVDDEKLMAIGLSNYRQAVRSAARGRRGFLTSTNRLACGADNVEVGDLVVIVLGAKVPFVVRKRSNGDGYTVLGEAYVYGYMDGEAADENAVVEQIVLH